MTLGSIRCKSAGVFRLVLRRSSRRQLVVDTATVVDRQHVVAVSVVDSIAKMSTSFSRSVCSERFYQQSPDNASATLTALTRFSDI